MRSVSSGVKATAAVIAVLTIFIVCPLTADEANPFQAPEARLQPPIGAMSSTTQPEPSPVVGIIAMWLGVFSLL